MIVKTASLTMPCARLALTLGASFVPPDGPYIAVKVGNATLYWPVIPRD